MYNNRAKTITKNKKSLIFSRANLYIYILDKKSCIYLYFFVTLHAF